jgi:threonine/homoserine/homoserine lactone efflux protein
VPEFNSRLIVIGAGLLLNADFSTGRTDQLRTRYAVATWLNRATGAIFLTLGVRLALESRR